MLETVSAFLLQPASSAPQVVAESEQSVLLGVSPTGRCALAACVVDFLSKMLVAGSVASVVKFPLGFEAVVEQIDSHHPLEW